jgi:predicted  nucleic acid-binding Zn-ribbon protein
MVKLGVWMVLFASLMFASESAATKADVQMILKVMEANKVDLENQIKATNERIDTIREDMNSRFNDVNNRFNDVNNRFNDVNNRIDDVNGYMLALIAGIFATVGFIWWDRRTMVMKTKEEVKEELQYAFDQKADHDLLTKVLEVMGDLAQEDEKVKEALDRRGLRVA